MLHLQQLLWNKVKPNKLCLVSQGNVFTAFEITTAYYEINKLQNRYLYAARTRYSNGQIFETNLSFFNSNLNTDIKFYEEIDIVQDPTVRFCICFFYEINFKWKNFIKKTVTRKIEHLRLIHSKCLKNSGETKSILVFIVFKVLTNLSPPFSKP